MSAIEYSATAKAVLTVEVPVRSSWGGNCDVEQIHKQAARDALEFIQNLRSPHGEPYSARLRVIGEPEITAVLVKKRP